MLLVCFCRIFDVNFKAIINVSQVVAKGIAANKIEGGTIVNIASVVSQLFFTNARTNT